MAASTPLAAVNGQFDKENLNTHKTNTPLERRVRKFIGTGALAKRNIAQNFTYKGDKKKSREKE